MEVTSSSQRDGRGSVPVSARRIRSPSLTMPTTVPFSTMGSALTWLSSIRRTSSSSGASGVAEITCGVITSAAFIVLFLGGAARGGGGTNDALVPLQVNRGGSRAILLRDCRRSK